MIVTGGPYAYGQTILCVEEIERGEDEAKDIGLSVGGELVSKMDFGKMMGDLSIDKVRNLAEDA